MPPNRLESNSPDDQPEKAPVATPPPRSGLGPWLPLLITVVTMPLLAFGMTQFVLLPKLQKSLGLTARARSEAEPAVKAERQSVPMTKLLVNVAGTMGARYLLVSLSVVGQDASFKTKLEASDPQLRDFACGVLATKTLVDLEKPGARNAIRSELIAGFNNILGGAMVQEIYLTEFAIQ